MDETTQTIPDHLGGYVPGGDAATWYPKLWRWLVRKQGVTSMIDVGAGEGLTVRYFEMLGVDAVGVDGVAQPAQPLVDVHDYTTGPYDPGRDFDLGWCCEFAEHVDERFESNWLATLSRCELVLFTHGDVGQPGHHHVNLHYAPYWVDRLRSIGFEWDEPLTTETRELAAVNPSPWNHYRRSGLAFRRIPRDRPPSPSKPQRASRSRKRPEAPPKTTGGASGQEKTSEQ